MYDETLPFGLSVNVVSVHLQPGDIALGAAQKTPSHIHSVLVGPFVIIITLMGSHMPSQRGYAPRRRGGKFSEQRVLRRKLYPSAMWQPCSKCSSASQQLTPADFKLTDRIKATRISTKTSMSSECVVCAAPGAQLIAKRDESACCLDCMKQ